MFFLQYDVLLLLLLLSLLLASLTSIKLQNWSTVILVGWVFWAF